MSNFKFNGPLRRIHIDTCHKYSIDICRGKLETNIPVKLKQKGTTLVVECCESCRGNHDSRAIRGSRGGYCIVSRGGGCIVMGDGMSFNVNSHYCDQKCTTPTATRQYITDGLNCLFNGPARAYGAIKKCCCKNDSEDCIREQDSEDCKTPNATEHKILRWNIVALRNVSEVHLQNASSVTLDQESDAFLDTKDTSLHVKGSGSLRLNTGVFNRLRLYMRGSGDLNAVNVDATSIYVGLTGSGDVSVRNSFCENTTVQMTGSGDVHVSCVTQNADVTLTGSGDIDIECLRSTIVSKTQCGSGDINIQRQ